MLFKMHCEQGVVRLSFVVEEPVIVNIRSWMHEGESNPELFVAIENDDVGPKKFIFRSMRS